LLKNTKNTAHSDTKSNSHYGTQIGLYTRPNRGIEYRALWQSGNGNTRCEILEMYSGKDTNTRQTVLEGCRLWEKATYKLI